MTLDARQRASIYQKLVPMLGEDDANALITVIPTADLDQLVTSHELRAAMRGLELRLTSQMAELDTRLTNQMAELDTRLTNQMAELRVQLSGEMGDLRADVTRWFRIQTMWLTTALLTAMALTAALTRAAG